MSKNTFLYLALALTVVFVAGFVYTQYLKPQLDNRPVAAVAQMSISSPVAPLMFKFPSGDGALALIEPPTGDVSSTGIKEVYLMMDSQQYVEFSKSEDETPPATISIFVLPYVEAIGAEEMNRVGKLQAWAVANTQFSSWGAATTEPQPVEVDGVRAITYKTESVYKQDVYLVLYADDIYVFTGQYETEGDEMQTMFNDILASVILN
jgi:hypothetical protein